MNGTAENSESLPLWLAIAAYLLTHFMVCAALNRRVASLRTERGIFLYHAVSFVALPSFLLATLETARYSVWLAIGSSIGLHGLYSLSFLELWSLAQGSYSLQLLAQVDRAGGSATTEELAPLLGIGVSKKAQRTISLRKLGLLGVDGSPTRLGSAACGLLRAIAWISGSRRLN